MLRILFVISLFYSCTLSAQTKSKKVLRWNFPLSRTHAGMLLANGTQGLMIWGSDNELSITIARAGFWDHRGGNDFSTHTNYAQVKKLLEANDEAGIRHAFGTSGKESKEGIRPRQMGGGVLKIRFPKAWKIIQGELILSNAEIKITCQDASGHKRIITIEQDPLSELARITLPNQKRYKTSVELLAAYEQENVKELLLKADVAPPRYWSVPDTKGFTQTLPNDAPLSVAYHYSKNTIFIATHLGENINTLKDLFSKPIEFSLEAKNKWWASYWADVPHIDLPDPLLQEIVDYGLYKQACSTPPQGVACTLQGPFMEEYQLPPWSNDYHFNINEQMIYTPALATNRLSHMEPLWKMLKTWMPQLQANGENFFGRKNALMLPHAVDDRCQVVGNFWTGTIDHASTAWMAYLAWQHYAYSMNDKILEETAYPLLAGAFEGYWAMLEEVDDGKGGKRWSLPVSVSPEFRGSQMNAWGRDASFQLAALHRVASVLPLAASKLGKPIDPRWHDVSERLPLYTLFEGPRTDEYPSVKSTRIALWEGQDLIESHRHHSHLGGIYPFATYNPLDDKHNTIVQASINRWTNRGMGMWTGWCVPWASILFSRTGNTEAAVSALHYWNENFVNEGRGTLHNSNKPGVSMAFNPIYDKLPEKSPKKEIMQLDAGFGALSAVLELLVQNREDGIYVLPDLHYQWKALTFENILAEGAFQISAVVSSGIITKVKVKSLAGGPLRLVHGLGDVFFVNGKQSTGVIYKKDCAIGEEIILTRN